MPAVFDVPKFLEKHLGSDNTDNIYTHRPLNNVSSLAAREPVVHT
jgi:hypothetical protein